MLIFLLYHRNLPPLEFELLPAASSPSGQIRLRYKPATLASQAYSSIPPPPTSAQPNPCSRLQEIIARVGEICLSPELAYVMLFPNHALAYQSGLTTMQDFPDERRAACHDPLTVLAAMEELPSASFPVTQAAKFLAKFHTECLPVPITTAFRQPIHVCAWKLESPARVCLYTGDHPSSPDAIDLANFAPHTLSKQLLEERSRRPTPSSIHLIGQDDLSPAAIRGSLLHFAQTGLTPHRERLKQGGDAQDHTLEEATACLIHAPTRNHTEIGLNQSPPWDKNHIDSRSATPHQVCLFPI